jgi:predicted acetyltransferase
MKSAPEVKLRAATKEDLDCVEMLMQFYHYDASEWISLDVTDNGRYAFRSIERFWQGTDQFPFVILVDGAIAGFAVVDKEVTSAGTDFNVAYLFVLRRFRGQRVGYLVAQQLFTQFRGRWEVYQVEQNVDAIRFWRRVIGDFTQGNFEERALEIDGRNCVQQLFQS